MKKSAERTVFFVETMQLCSSELHFGSRRSRSAGAQERAEGGRIRKGVPYPGNGVAWQGIPCRTQPLTRRLGNLERVKIFRQLPRRRLQRVHEKVHPLPAAAHRAQDMLPKNGGNGRNSPQVRRSLRSPTRTTFENWLFHLCDSSTHLL